MAFVVHSATLHSLAYTSDVGLSRQREAICSPARAIEEQVGHGGRAGLFLDNYGEDKKKTYSGELGS